MIQNKHALFDLFDPNLPIDAEGVVAIYEYLRSRIDFPKPQMKVPAPESCERLFDILPNFDALLLDGYGVLNIGDEAIIGAAELLSYAAQNGIEVIVVTNGASKPSSVIAARYRAMGIPIEDERIISSRDALLDALGNEPLSIGDSFVDLPHGENFMRLDPDASETWLIAEAIGVFGARHWDEHWQKNLMAAMQKDIPLHIANPDVGAPQGEGFSFEPGFWIASALHQLGKAETSKIHWYGKPHAPIFALALERLNALTNQNFSDPSRIAMVGDSLHTDILGGMAAGLSTVLVKNHGLFKNSNLDEIIATTNIIPDFITETL